jgi:hypothetical protein
MIVERTEKQFTKGNITEEFVRNAVSIGGGHKLPLNTSEYPFFDFEVIEKYEARDKDGNSVYPWDDIHQAEGYSKMLFITEIKLKDFDTEVVIFNRTGKLQPYYVRIDERGNRFRGKQQYAPDSIKWVNLLIKHGYANVKSL